MADLGLPHSSRFPLSAAEQEKRREKWNSMPDARGGNGWKEVRKRGDLCIEVFGYGGPKPAPTVARIVRYGPRGGVHIVIAGDSDDLERQRNLIDLADQAIYEVERR